MYDPFSRGSRPVGVRTRALSDEARGRRTLTVELYYPASDQHGGADLDPSQQDRFEIMPGLATGIQAAVRDAEPASGRWPVVVFSHGFGAHRRQSSLLCTHLASHGYAVLAPDHSGNTMQDVMSMFLNRTVRHPFANLGAVIEDRPADLSFVVDGVSVFGLDEHLDTGRFGVAGHSFGGWTALQAAGRDPRIAAAFLLAPAGGDHPAGNALGDALDLGWPRETPSLFLVAERDSLLSLEPMKRLFQRVASHKRMFVLLGADHAHFCDQPRQLHEMLRAFPAFSQALRSVDEIPPFDTLCPAEHGLVTTRALGLAHFDANLRNLAEADTFIAEEAVGELTRRGIAVERF